MDSKPPPSQWLVLLPSACSSRHQVQVPLLVLGPARASAWAGLFFALPGTPKHQKCESTDARAVRNMDAAKRNATTLPKWSGCKSISSSLIRAFITLVRQLCEDAYLSDHTPRRATNWDGIFRLGVQQLVNKHTTNGCWASRVIGRLNYICDSHNR